MPDSSRTGSRHWTLHLLWIIPALALVAVVAVPGFSLPHDTREITSRAASFQDSILGVTRESDGAVTVALTPKEFSEGRLTVEIAVNTHTVNDLHTYDLTRIVTLDAGGEQVSPLSAPTLEGHHSGGDLVFPLDTMPEALRVEIRGLNGVDLRTFSWP